MTQLSSFIIEKISLYTCNKVFSDEGNLNVYMKIQTVGKLYTWE